MKNKKLFLLIIFIFCLILSSLGAYFTNYQAQATLALQQIDTSHRFIPFKLPFTAHDKKQFQQIIISLNESANETNLNYMEKHYYEGYPIKDGKPDYNKSLQKQNFYVYKLDQTQFLGNFGALGSNKQKYSYTYPLLSGYQVTIQPLAQALHARKNFEGIFFLETLEQEKYSHFIKLLDKKLSQRFKTHYALSDYQVTQTTQLLLPSFEVDPNLKTIINYLIVFIVVSLLVYLLLEWSKLRLYKLNGHSFTRSFLAIAIKPLGVILLAFSYDLWLVFQGLDLSELLSQQLLVFGLAFSGAYLLMLGMYCISLDELKERYFSSILFLLLGGAKLLLLVTLINSLAPVGNIVIDSYELLKQDTNPKLKDYAEIFPSVIGSDAVNSFDNYEDLKNIYKLADKQGALLFDDTGSSYIQPPDVPRELADISININYLKAYPLYDVNNKKIKLDPRSKQTILVFPITKKNLVAKRLQQERNISKISRKYGVKVMYSDPRYNNNFKNIVTGKNIANEIIHVIPPGNIRPKINDPILNILSGFEHDRLLFALKGTTLAKLKQQWDPILTKYNLSDNAPQFIRYDHGASERLKIELGDIFAYSSSQGLLLLTIISLSFYCLLSFFNKNVYNIGLKNTLGYSRLRNYWPYWCFLLFQYSLTPLFYTDVYLSKTIYFTLDGLFFVLEFFILNLFISYLESEAKKNVK